MRLKTKFSSNVRLGFTFTSGCFVFPFFFLFCCRYYLSLPFLSLLPNRSLGDVVLAKQRFVPA